MTCNTPASLTLPPARNVALCGNIHQDEYVAHIAEFISLLLQRGVITGVESRFFKYLSSHFSLPGNVKSLEYPTAATDVIVSVGGDGTFLKTARWTGSSGIPILGLNTGHLGFLANYSIDETSDLIDMLLAGNATLEERMLLQLSCSSMPEDFCPFALNEVAVLKEETSSMIKAHVTSDSDFLATYQADGLIIATPTGSTAYNLSTGGPILQPRMSCMVLSPVAPHSLTLRPIVIDGGSRLEVTVGSRASDFRVSVDGNSFTLPCGESLRIQRAPYTIRTIRRPGDSFASTLRKKLLWGKS